MPPTEHEVTVKAPEKIETDYEYVNDFEEFVKNIDVSDTISARTEYLQDVLLSDLEELTFDDEETLFAFDCVDDPLRIIRVKMNEDVLDIEEARERKEDAIKEQFPEEMINGMDVSMRDHEEWRYAPIEVIMQSEVGGEYTADKNVFTMVNHTKGTWSGRADADLMEEDIPEEKNDDPW